MIRGIDASAVQGALPPLGPEYRFVILKAQQGNDGFDPWLVRNAKTSLERGLEVFAYCFAYPLPPGKPGRDPKEQAKLFVDKTFKACPELEGKPLFLDYEWPPVVQKDKKGWKDWGCNPQQLSDWMEANAAEVKSLTGRSPVIYTYDWWWSSVRDGAPAYGYPKGADVSWAAQYPLWMAWYTSGRQGAPARWPKPGERPKVPAPWADWLFWQWDGNGGFRLPNGVDSDACVFNGSEGDLKAWARGPQPDRPVGDGVLGRAAIDTVERK